MSIKQKLPPTVIASYASDLWACHAIFLPNERESDCVTSPKNVCVGG